MAKAKKTRVAPATSTEPGSPTDPALRERLQAAGLRVTAVRLLVLKSLKEMNSAASHADIEANLPQAVDRVTLYRTLDSFVSAGLAQSQVGAERVTRFAISDGADHTDHAHFQCDDCGHVYCMPVKPPRRVQLPAGFDMAGAALHFHGHCPSCTGKSVGQSSG